MIKKLIRQMLTAQILSALTVSLCLLIDSIIIGRFLGVQAIAAYGLSNPILLIIGAFGTALSAGVQVVCSRALGRGKQEEANEGFSSAVGLAAVFSIPFMVLVLLFATQASRLLGANSEVLLMDTRSYIRGFIIGAPATMGALILVPFLQMAGQTGLLIASVGAMTVIDIALDILNVTVFHGGMFGMGLASSLSYYGALLIGGSYFFSKKCFFRFSAKLISLKKIRELFECSIPAVFNMASSVVLVFLMNRLLLNVGGSDAVAAFSVISTIGNASNCITTGLGGVSLTLTGIFYQEEDRTGLKTLLSEITRWSLILGAAVGLALVVFSPAAASLFIKDPGPSKQLAVFGLRIYGPGLIPCCFVGALKNAYQGARREKLTELISVMEGAAFPLLTAFLLSFPFGTKGALFYFTLGEALTLLAICLIVRMKTRKSALKDLNVLMLPERFSEKAGDRMELDIQTIEDVAEGTARVHSFCMERGQDAKIANRLAVCFEEMASNVILHGFTKDGREHHLSFRISRNDGQWTIRFRDDCVSFDPIRYVPKGGPNDKGMGIRLVLQLADEVRYTSTMNLNNLMIMMKDSTVAGL
ncbi:MAG: MATE family efflux transporter [Lachnospiraceae bacterium]|nr:MATE family efflux transporter [Lachnospiraceae bacterium]